MQKDFPEATENSSKYFVVHSKKKTYGGCIPPLTGRRLS